MRHPAKTSKILIGDFRNKRLVAGIEFTLVVALSVPQISIAHLVVIKTIILISFALDNSSWSWFTVRGSESWI